jgi:hypothetical protein
MKTQLIALVSVVYAFSSLAAFAQSSVTLVEGNPISGSAREIKAETVCPSGTQVIGGGCNLDDPGINTVQTSIKELGGEYKIVSFGLDTNRNSYVCVARQLSGTVSDLFSQEGFTPGSITANATCLKN